MYFCEHFAGVNEARTVFNCSCPHVTYLKLLFLFKDIISSCHWVHFPRKANLLKRLKLHDAFSLIPEQLFLLLPVLPLPFLPGKRTKHKYFKLVLLATNEMNNLRRLYWFYFCACQWRKAVDPKRVVTIFSSTEGNLDLSKEDFLSQVLLSPWPQSNIKLGRGSGWKNGLAVQPLKQRVTVKLMA